MVGGKQSKNGNVDSCFSRKMTCGFLLEKQWRKLSEMDTFPENIITDKVCKGTVLWIGHALFMTEGSLEN